MSPQDRKVLLERKEEEDDSELDFGDDDDEDSDDDYKEESFVKPWQQKKKLLRKSSQLDRDESDYSSSDEGEAPKLEGEKGADPEAELADYIKVTIPRRRLAQWCSEPYFEGVVMNCFVRLGIGEIDGKKCYRLCEIVGVVPSKSEYKFPATHKHSKPVSIREDCCCLNFRVAALVNSDHSSFI